ncbi:GNAT family N-acetyltransferase [Salsuginibacillus kocurii]|uniref:GNAT family N-acetyltransferase n=1 Tax=Salsuginibacillus kocurii TaxID=427078 RepID=UPI000374F007|nr:GNAT family N-acetyltransferase [Salsuginibacillus kocurii]
MLRTFETDRLILRERTLDDVELCMEMDREAEVVKYVPEIKTLVGNERKHREFIVKRTEAQYPAGMGYWMIESKDDQQQIIGWILLIPMDAVGPEIEIGWRLKPKYWGKGYATEAAKVILHYAFESLEIEEIVADINKMNKGSIRVAEKIGLEYKGLLETSAYIRYAIYRH